VEAGPRILASFAESLAAAATAKLLVLMSSRLGTLFRWSWKLLTRQRLARLIIEPEPLQGGIQATQHNGQRTNEEAEKSSSSRIARMTVQ
jgi:hypothetical protein